jgi:hypothetical protein
VPEETPATDELDRILAAVREELSRWGIDRFDTAATAARHGLDPEIIAQHWPNPSSLVLDALAQRPGGAELPPDTGSFLEDLYLLAQRMAAQVDSDDGRKLHGAHIITDQHLATVDIRRTAWRARADSLLVVFERAQQRGELRDGVDAVTALEMLFAPINMRVVYTGDSVTDEYCRRLADMVWRATAA